MGKTLVAYFSATGTTERLARTLAEVAGADLHGIEPAQPYTSADLNWHDARSRSSVEMNDPASRPAIASKVADMERYDTVFVGFPIWWNDMPRIMYTFFDTYDFSGKTIAPFCTSGGSGISGAVSNIEELEPSATVTEGLRTSPSDAEGDIAEWLESIGLVQQEG